jgi:hypothetical protein
MGELDPARSRQEDLVESSILGMVPRAELFVLHFVCLSPFPPDDDDHC